MKKREKLFSLVNFVASFINFTFMQIISYNINGIRAAVKKGFDQWLVEQAADVYCLQELKAQEEQIDTDFLTQNGYHFSFHTAVKKGYSGVGIISKEKPDEVIFGCGIEDIDKEGRVLTARFGDVYVMSLYFPSGSSGSERQAFKMSFLAQFQSFIEDFVRKHPKVVLAGDFNICREAIDIHDPVRNAKKSGFLPEEREWFARFLDRGFVDSFRQRHPENVTYSWWSYRAASRKRNKGWRIDYLITGLALAPKIKAAEILTQVNHADHCPILLEIEKK